MDRDEYRTADEKLAEQRHSEPAMRLRRGIAFTVCICITLVACADLEAMSALSTAIETQYHLPANIKITNGSHLAITFDRSSIEAMKFDSAGLASFARNVAKFASAKYHGSTPLADVRIAFQSTSTTGLVTVTRTDAPYSFTVSELQ